MRVKLIQADFSAVKSKAEADPIAQKLVREALSQADELAAAEFPSAPIRQRDYAKRIDGHYSETYLEILQEYDRTSWLYDRAFRKLAFAYKLTGDSRYLAKFEQALHRCVLNETWGPKGNEYDHCSSRILRSLSISLTWLERSVSSESLGVITERMKREVQGFYKKYERMNDDYPLGPNDHQSKDLSGAGCAAWYLMKRDPSLKRCLDRFIFLFQNKLLEETIEKDGGWPDGWACVLYALMDAAPFLEVIEDCTGVDLTRETRLRNTCDFFIVGLPLHTEEAENQALYRYAHTVFWLAAAYQRRDIQFIAERMVHTPVKRDFNEYAVIYYDEKLKAEEFAGGGMIMTRSVGWGRLGWGTNTDQVYLWLKSGPTDAFCRNNQNGIYLTAFGRKLLHDVTLAGVSYRTLWKCVYEEGLWTTKCANALLVNGQNQIRNRYGEDWGPIMKFHQPNRNKWGDDDAWWFDYEAPKAALGRLVGASGGDDTASVSGRADRCYGDLLSGYTRTCLMTKDGIVVIADRLVPTEQARNFQFRLNTPYRFCITAANRAAVIAEEVRSDIVILYDGDFTLSVQEWPFDPNRGQYLTADFPLQGHGEPVQLVTVMRPCRSTPEQQFSAALHGDRLVVRYGGSGANVKNVQIPLNNF
jgi:hypothetical protein